jgi:hypothetical protein
METKTFTLVGVLTNKLLNIEAVGEDTNSGNRNKFIIPSV